MNRFFLNFDKFCRSFADLVLQKNMALCAEIKMCVLTKQISSGYYVSVWGTWLPAVVGHDLKALYPRSSIVVCLVFVHKELHSL